jgi:hypothetical protein
LRSPQTAQLKNTHPDRIDTCTKGPEFHLNVERRVGLPLLNAVLIGLNLVLFLYRAGGERGWGFTLGCLVAVYFWIGVCRDAVWEWKHPIIVLLSSDSLRWRRKHGRIFTEVSLAEVVSCRVEYGNDLRLTLRSGIEHALDLNRIPKADRADFVTALKGVAGRS